jgi:hypothetical protein
MKENIESLSTIVERSQMQIEWRRSKVAELDSQDCRLLEYSKYWNSKDSSSD